MSLEQLSHPGEPARFSAAALLAALLALSACAGLVHPDAAHHLARPGFSCNAGRAFQDSAWAMWMLDENGAPVDTHMEWNAPRGDIFTPRLGVIWSGRGRTPLRIEEGLGFLQWTRRPTRGGRLPTLRLELTTDPDGHGWVGAPFAGAWERAGMYSIHKSWGDLAAFARGAAQLTAVLRDRRGNIFDRAPIDPALFARASAEITAILEQMREVSADFRNQCRPVEDIDPRIVVT